MTIRLGWWMIWNSDMLTLFLVFKVLNSKIQLGYKISKSHLELAMLGVLPCLFIDTTVNGNARVLKVQSRIWLIPHYLTPILWPVCWWCNCYLHFFSLFSSLFGRKQYWYQSFASVHTFPEMLHWHGITMTLTIVFDQNNDFRIMLMRLCQPV